MSRRCQNPAFTLLELVLVMIVLSIALAVTAPSLRGWARGSELRDCADRFVALTHRARTLAISEARVYRVSVDPNVGTYHLAAQQGETFVPAGTTRDRTFHVPTGVRMTFNKTATATRSIVLGAIAPAGNTSTLDFSPTGATESATVTFTSQDGTRITVECSTPAQGFATVPGTGGQS